MYLGGQEGQRGYAMAAVLVSVAVMAIVMTALLPVWRHQAQREKEAELAFRGEQYARAIYLFTTKNGGQNPPSIDALVQGKYLRKKYKDPMTEDGEFLPLSVGANQPGPQTGTGGGSNLGGGDGRGGRGGRGGQPSPGLGGGPVGGVQGGGGIMMVVSKSKEPSIRIYNGAAHYNEWRFLYNRQGRGGQGGPGGRGGAGGVGGPGGGPTRGQPGIGTPGGGGPGGAPGRGNRGTGPGRGGGAGRGSFPGGRGQ